MPYFLGLSSGRSFTALPPNLAQLWQAGLLTSAGYVMSVEQPIVQRLQRIYAVGPVAVTWDHNTRETLVAWCLDIARQRVEGIVSNQHRGSYGKAATLTVACAEALRLGGNASGGNAFLESHPHAFSAPQRLPGRIARRNRPDGTRQISVAGYHLSHFANTPPTLR